MNNYIGSIGNAYMTNSSDLSAIENIKGNSKSEKEQLKKVASEFESIFVSKMMISGLIHLFSGILTD